MINTIVAIFCLLIAVMGMVNIVYGQNQSTTNHFPYGGHWTFHSGRNVLCNDVTGSCMNLPSGYICTKTLTMSCD